jgi:hypothetical protein
VAVVRAFVGEDEGCVARGIAASQRAGGARGTIPNTTTFTIRARGWTYVDAALASQRVSSNDKERN